MSGYDGSIPDLIKSTIHDAQELVRGEIALAKAEMRQEVRRYGMGAAALAGAALAAIVAIVFLLTALAWAIPQLTAWPAWTGFAIVGALVLIVALVMAAVGRKRFNGERPMPLTLDTMKENMQWTRAQRS